MTKPLLDLKRFRARFVTMLALAQELLGDHEYGLRTK